MPSLKFDVRTARVASGANVSSLVPVGNGRIDSIWAPVVDSGTTVKIKGSTTTDSAEFVRLVSQVLGAGGSNFSNDWAWVTQGSEGIIFDNPIAGFPFVKIETDLAQDDNRDFRIVINF